MSLELEPLSVKYLEPHLQLAREGVFDALNQAEAQIIDAIAKLRASQIEVNSHYEHQIGELNGSLRVIHEERRKLESSVYSPSKANLGARKRVFGKSLSGKVREMARDLLLRSDRPLTRGEILQNLVENGLVITSPEPEKFIGKILWRDPSFENVGNGYRLVEHPN